MGGKEQRTAIFLAELIHCQLISRVFYLVHIGKVIVISFLMKNEKTNQVRE